MSSRQVFQQFIYINATLAVVDRCITDQILMHQWLNPLLECQPVGTWDTRVGGRSQFRIKLPLVQPTLESVVVERKPGLVVWEFDGFFQGRDRWECQVQGAGTELVNRFEFSIPNPWVERGFNWFAASFTQADMKQQLRRLKQVAEREEERGSFRSRGAFGAGEQ